MILQDNHVSIHSPFIENLHIALHQIQELNDAIFFQSFQVLNLNIYLLLEVTRLLLLIQTINKGSNNIILREL
jgi:hypothetical protein